MKTLILSVTAEATPETVGSNSTFSVPDDETDAVQVSGVEAVLREESDADEFDDSVSSSPRALEEVTGVKILAATKARRSEKSPAAEVRTKSLAR